uniref:Uncharacterized protein n=1 Tax=Romanomermis culicivorax TaxID=13658 RepID=A0A915HI18_ROMCU
MTASRLKTGWGPNTNVKRGTYVVGTNPHPLKYYYPFYKKPHQPYGLQDSNHLLPEKGHIKARMPCRVRLEKDRIYLWCTCGLSNNQILPRNSANAVEKRIYFSSECVSSHRIT